MSERTYTLTEFEAAMAFKQVSSHCEALKNWMASAVEAGEHEKAAELVRELRQYQNLFAKLNVAAHKQIDAMRAEREHPVVNRLNSMAAAK